MGPAPAERRGAARRSQVSEPDAQYVGKERTHRDTKQDTCSLAFMQDMIDHHAMAVEMAEICVDKAVHEELRSLYKNINAMQSQEVETMQTWLASWYSVSHEPQMAAGEMHRMETVASLRGAEFEIAFMEEMIGHHEQAITEAE